MATQHNKLKIMLLAGEASGDHHGAQLLEAIQAEVPGASFFGMGGTDLKKAGMDVLVDASEMAVVGLFEVISHFPLIRRSRQKLLAAMADRKPDLLICIDYPDFNLNLAGKAKKRGIPIFYFISPQVWAWRSGRVKTIKKLINRMAVILPFERSFYQERGVDVDYVGHPLVDSVGSNADREQFRHTHALTGTVVGLLPGSRRKEISNMLPIMLESAELLIKKNPDTSFVLPLAPGLDPGILAENGLAQTKLPIKVIQENRYDVMAATDLVIAASGTVTLELALLNVPMVVSYKLSPLTYAIGRHLVKVKFASLVNLVADREVVPELLQDQATGENIAAALTRIWPGAEGRGEMLTGLAWVRHKLGGTGACTRAARLALTAIKAK